MQIYNYDPTTGRYLGASMADADREQPGEWLLPAFSTAQEPPSAPAGKFASFDRKADAWALRDEPVRVVAEEAANAAAQPTIAQAALMRRQAALAATDWAAVRAFETGEPVPEDLKAYRQALRDIPTQAGYPDEIEWPVFPG